MFLSMCVFVCGCVCVCVFSPLPKRLALLFVLSLVYPNEMEEQLQCRWIRPRGVVFYSLHRIPLCATAQTLVVWWFGWYLCVKRVLPFSLGRSVALIVFFLVFVLVHMVVICGVVIVFVLYDLSKKYTQRQIMGDKKEIKTHIGTKPNSCLVSHLVLGDIRTCSHRGNRDVFIEVTVVKLLKLLHHMFLGYSLHLKTIKESKQRWCMI